MIAVRAWNIDLGIIRHFTSILCQSLPRYYQIAEEQTRKGINMNYKEVIEGQIKKLQDIQEKLMVYDAAVLVATSIADLAEKANRFSGENPGTVELKEESSLETLVLTVASQGKRIAELENRIRPEEITKSVMLRLGATYQETLKNSSSCEP